MSCEPGMAVKVDFLWEEQRLAVQIDGPNQPSRGQDEGCADRILEARGYRVLHITEHEVIAEPDRIATLIARELDRAT
jgi:very-short-patch-repair endonuclease